MQIQVLPPHPALARQLMHVMAVDMPDGGASHLAANLFPVLTLYVRGGARVTFPDGSQTTSHRMFLRGPFMSPVRVDFQPGTVFLSVGLRAGALLQAFGIRPGDILAQVRPLAQVLDPLAVERFLHSMDTPRDLPACVDLFQQFLTETLRPSRTTSIGAAFMAARQKLFFPMVELSQHFGIGQRQLERRVLETFGVTLRDVRRVARFGMSLPLIVDQNVGWGDLTRIAHDAGYYDQAHMHREFIDMVGLPPLQLLQKIASDDPAFWLYRLDGSDFKKLFIPSD